jgi:MIP family channel proteins
LASLTAPGRATRLRSRPTITRSYPLVADAARGRTVDDLIVFPPQELTVVNAASDRRLPGAGVAPLGRPAAYAAELIGTFGLVLFIVLVLTISAPPPLGIGGPDFAVVGLVHAFALMLLIAALGGVCGAHFNPAVTVGMLSTRRIGLGDACAYVVMQLVGAVLAALLVKALMNGSASAAHFGAPNVVSGRFLNGSSARGMVAEAVGAFFLMWAIMGTVVNPRGDRSWGAFVIGATLGLAVMCIAPLTGAGLNPARAFGPALLGGFGPAGDWLLAFVVGPVAGAVLAAQLYTAVAIAPQPRTAGGEAEAAGQSAPPAPAPSGQLGIARS